VWRESLLLWKLSLKANPQLAGLLIVLMAILNLLTFLPPFSMVALLLNYYLLFSFVGSAIAVKVLLLYGKNPEGLGADDILYKIC